MHQSHISGAMLSVKILVYWAYTLVSTKRRLPNKYSMWLNLENNQKIIFVEYYSCILATVMVPVKGMVQWELIYFFSKSERCVKDMMETRMKRNIKEIFDECKLNCLREER
jgi:hypothetical protein